MRRRLLALSLLLSSLAFGCAAAGLGLAAPAALAAGTASTAAVSTTPAVTPPSLNLNNATQNAAGVSTPAVEETIPATTTTSSGSGLSGLDALIIAIVAALVLGGIAFWVWYDARRTASHIRHHADDDSMFARAHAGSKAAPKQRKLKPAERKRRKRGRAR
jgi:hypothetical protein